jgi:hypothetical protein
MRGGEQSYYMSCGNVSSFQELMMSTCFTP